MLHIVLMWSARLYPFTDVPNHLGLATVYRHYGEPSNHFNELYALNLSLKPNTLHLYFVSLRIFPSVEFGNKVFYCLYVIVFPLSMLFAIRRFGGNPWFASCLFCFYIIIMLPMVLSGLPSLFRLLLFYSRFCRVHNETYTAAETGLRFVAAAFFFMHALAALFAAFVFLICVVWHSNTGDSIGKNIAVLPCGFNSVLVEQ